MTAVPEPGGTPGQADLKLAFENWFGRAGYDDDGMFSADDLEFAFEAGAEAERDRAVNALAAVLVAAKVQGDTAVQLIEEFSRQLAVTT